MTFVVKAIKPQKMKVDAIRLEILNELRREGKTHVKLLEQTTATWQHDVKFGFLISLAGSDASVLSGPSGGDGVQIWERLDTQGITPPNRDIVPVRARALRFHTGYRAKTTVGKLTSRPGGSFGPVIFRRRVRASARRRVPARQWSQTLGKQRIKPFRDAVLAATRRGAERMY